AAAAVPPGLLDCDDKMAHGALRPYQVNPFAKEVCGDGIDEDCDGVDPPCVDADGDGDPDDSDCMPSDPKVHHPNRDPSSPHYDPYPESANCCGYSLGRSGPDRGKLLGSDPTCRANTCGDGI